MKLYYRLVQGGANGKTQYIITPTTRLAPRPDCAGKGTLVLAGYGENYGKTCQNLPDIPIFAQKAKICENATTYPKPFKNAKKNASMFGPGLTGLHSNACRLECAVFSCRGRVHGVLSTHPRKSSSVPPGCRP